jgi:uncharacterized protein (TIGR03083 family)
MTTTGLAPALQLPLRSAIERTTAMRLAATEYERFVGQLRQLTPAEWARPTVCPDWDVRAMAGHVLGMAEMSASVPEGIRQMRTAGKQGGEFIDALTALQVAKTAALSTTQLVDRFAAVGPKAARGRRRTPFFVRGRTMPGDQPLGDGSRETWKFGFLIDVCLTRDTWMHRMDICRAVDAKPELTADHDGVLIADVAIEWAARHAQPCTLKLGGPAGGSWIWGSGGPLLELDAVDFCRILSGRGDGEGLLATRVPF